MRPELLDGLTPIRGFADQNHVSLIGHQSSDSLADYRMVIDR
jgi:hypothetical protein